MILRAHFGDETLSKTQVCNWNKSFKKDWTEDKNMQRLHLLQGKICATFFGTLKISYSSFSDRTMNHQYSLLFKAS
jgi:hypothetical protein